MADKFAGQDVRSLRPVYDPHNPRKVLGYVDRAGRQWGVDGKRTAGLPSGGGYATSAYGADADQQQAIDRARNVPPTATAANRVNQARQLDHAESIDLAKTTESRALNAAQKNTFAWVDGQRMMVTGSDTDANGQVTLHLSVGNKQQDYAVPSAYDALDSSPPDPNVQFLMSIGLPTNSQNQTRPLSLANVLHPGTFGSSNYMTIGNGLTWLASLSAKDPHAYQAMIDKLHAARYLTDAQYAAAAGGYTSEAAQGFAFAARDVAVLNGNGGTIGAATTLDEFLSQKASAASASDAAATAQAYQPVTRKYTDPEAVKAAAKTQAQQLLGRLLTPEEESALVGHFHSLEDGMYNQVDAIGRSGAGGGSVTAPDAGGQIDEFLDSGAREQEQANYRAAQYGSALRRLFGVGG